MWLDENEDTYCVWRTEFDEGENICYYGVDLFTRSGKKWDRAFEEHRQYAYSVEELTAYLHEAGFTGIRVFGDMTMDAPGEKTQRMLISARKD